MELSAASSCAVSEKLLPPGQDLDGLGLKGGFFHDGRFATLEDVIAHYDTFVGLRLANRDKRDLAEDLKSL